MAREGASVAVAGDHLSPVKETVQSIKEIAKNNGHKNVSYQGFETDVSSSEQVKSLVDEISREFANGPPLSVVVNGAGIIRDSLLLKQSEKDLMMSSEST